MSIFSNPIFAITSFNSSSFYTFLTSIGFFLPCFFPCLPFFFFSSLKIVLLFFSCSFILGTLLFITLLSNASNLFEGWYVELFFHILSLFLQLWVMCPKSLHMKHLLFYIVLFWFFLLLHSFYFQYLCTLSTFILLSFSIFIYSTIFYSSFLLLSSLSSLIFLLLLYFLAFIFLSYSSSHLLLLCFLTFSSLHSIFSLILLIIS